MSTRNVDMTTRGQAFVLRIVMWLQTLLTVIAVGAAGAIIILSCFGTQRQPTTPHPLEKHELNFTV